MTTELNRLSTELAEATADHALLQHLQGAKQRMEKLSKEYDTALEASRKAEADRKVSQQEERFAKISDLSITEKDGHLPTVGLLNRTYEISWMAPSYDGELGRSIQKRHCINGFRFLPDDVLEYIVVKQPNLIPEAIRDLAPGNPTKALNEYFVSFRRGYTRGPVQP